MLASFIPMYYLDVTANIMSLGGIALAIGVLVDASIVMVENAYRHLSEPERDVRPTDEPSTDARAGEDGTATSDGGRVPYEAQPRVVIDAAKQVGRPIFFSLAIIIISVSGSVLRLRPKLMTVSVVMASLVPIMWSQGVGSDVMKPIAAPIVGGMITLTIHVLIVTPVIFYIMKMRALRKGMLKESGMHL